MRFGDMTVLGEPPAKLLKAFAVIADTLHPTFDRQVNLIPFVSRRSCVLCSLTVRDFLRRIGFADAVERSVCVAIYGLRLDGEIIHSVGIGAPHDKRILEDSWNGHLVVTVDGFMIDTTLYQAKRPAWPDLEGMMALPLAPKPWPRGLWRRPTIATVCATTDDREIHIGWFDDPRNKRWQLGGDARLSRREPVVAALVDRFGRWVEGAKKSSRWGSTGSQVAGVERKASK